MPDGAGLSSCSYRLDRLRAPDGARLPYDPSKDSRTITDTAVLFHTRKEIECSITSAT